MRFLPDAQPSLDSPNLVIDSSVFELANTPTWWGAVSGERVIALSPKDGWEEVPEAQPFWLMLPSV